MGVDGAGRGFAIKVSDVMNRFQTAKPRTSVRRGGRSKIMPLRKNIHIIYWPCCQVIDLGQLTSPIFMTPSESDFCTNLVFANDF